MATNDKYDRQLRLWGAKGQKALAETTVVLLRATAAGTETLKNLVLPGIGHFHVLDDVPAIGNVDASSNFFLVSSSSSTRAQVACEHLQELNPDVRGTYQHVEDLNDVEDWISLLRDASSSSNTSKQTLVIASDLEPPLLEKVSIACHDGNNKTAMIMVQSYGLMGIVRIQTPPLALLDPKPTNSPPDLRLVNNFPKFVDLADSIDWKSLDDQKHGHMPYPLILYQVAKEWKQMHNGNLPQSFAEKQDFRKCIQQKSRDYDKELNFQEAVDNAYLAYTERSVDCLEGEFATEIDQPTTKLGQLLDALRKFIQVHGRPPLNGSIPDMTASTDIYVQLQTIYRDQAAKDIQDMKSYLSSSSASSMDTSDDTNGSSMLEVVSDDDLASFCANVFAIGRLQTRSLVDEYHSPPPDELLEDLMMATYDPYEVKEHTPLVWYLAFRACQLFYQDHRRYPGVDNNDWEKEDVPLLQQCISKVVEHYRLQDNDLIGEVLAADEDKKVAHEMARYANAEIHTVASVVGGVASQEAVKVITGQYIPVDNTYMYNGIASVGSVLRF